MNTRFITLVCVALTLVLLAACDPAMFPQEAQFLLTPPPVRETPQSATSSETESAAEADEATDASEASEAETEADAAIETDAADSEASDAAESDSDDSAASADTEATAEVVEAPTAPVMDIPQAGMGLTDGALTLTGSGQPGSTVQLLIDEAVAGEVEVADDGSWSLDAPMPETGDYQVQVQTVAADGTIATGSEAALVSVIGGEVSNVMVEAVEVEVMAEPEAEEPAAEAEEDVAEAAEEAETETTEEAAAETEEPAETTTEDAAEPETEDTAETAATEEPEEATTETTESAEEEPEEATTETTESAEEDSTEASTETAESAEEDTTEASESTETAETSEASEEAGSGDAAETAEETEADAAEAAAARQEALEAGKEKVEEAKAMAADGIVTLLFPIDGADVLIGELTIIGYGPVGTEVALLDGAESLGTTVINDQGEWTFVLEPAEGDHTLAVQSVGDEASTTEAIVINVFSDPAAIDCNFSNPGILRDNTWIVGTCDTFNYVSQDLGVALEDLIEANPNFGPNFDLIYPGQVLVIPE